MKGVLLVFKAASLYHVHTKDFVEFVCEEENLNFGRVWFEFQRELKVNGTVLYYAAHLIKGHDLLERMNRGRRRYPDRTGDNGGSR